MFLKFSRFTVLLTAISSIFISSAVLAEIENGYTNEIYSARHLWSDVNQSLANRSFTCPDLIEPKITFESGSIYKDTPCKCEVDPEKKALYEAEKDHIYQYSSQLTKIVDQYVATPIERDDIAMCAMEHIRSWTEHGAMTGEHGATTGYHKTAEVLGVIATSYSKIAGNKQVEQVTPETITGQWIKQTGERVIDYYANMAGPKTNANNHRYWDGLYVGRAASVIEDELLFDWAMDGLTIGLNEIQADGTLPLELARGSKAHSYHIYATIPLLGLAELAIENMEYMPEQYNPYLYNNGALHTLTLMLIQAEAQQYSELFSTFKPMTCTDAAMLEPYKRRAPTEFKTVLSDMIVEKRSQCYNKLYNTNFGGNISVLFGRP